RHHRPGEHPVPEPRDGPRSGPWADRGRRAAGGLRRSGDERPRQLLHEAVRAMMKTTSEKSPTERRKIRILIADDHAVVRSGLRSILESEDDIEVVGEAADGHQALEFAQELLPDVILMGINIGDWDGVPATRRVRNFCASL